MTLSLWRLRKKPSNPRRCAHILTALLLIVILGVTSSPSRAERPVTLELEKKAEFWAAHGRQDLSTQTYRQLLFLDPENRPALIALATEAIEQGKTVIARDYIRKIRKMNPQDPALPAFSRETELGAHWGREIAEARKDNARHLFSQALIHYQKAFGPYPPPPQYALEYYNDLTHTVGGTRAAIAQLRDLTAKYPESLHYRLALGEILSYDPTHRWESIDILKPMAEEATSVSDTATAAWRQVLLWEGTLPGNIPKIKAYLALHSDKKLERLLDLAEKRALSAGSASKNAFSSLNRSRFGQAVSRFRRLSSRDPENPAYWIGLSYAYLGLRKFDRARQALDRARLLPLSVEQTREESDLSRQISFWRLMERAKREEVNGSQAAADKSYRNAARIYPDQPDLLVARAHLAERSGNIASAEILYRRTISHTPLYVSPWAGLLTLYERTGQDRKALDSITSLSPAVREGLEKDSDFLMTEGSVFAHTGHPNAARASFSRALDSRQIVSADKKIGWGWTLLNAGEILPLGILLDRLDNTPGLTDRQRDALQSLHRLRALREEQGLVAKQDYAQALARMKTHASNHPSDRFYREREAVILEAQGNDRAAYALIQELGPGSTISSTEAAVGVAMATNHPIQAEVWIADARSRWPESVRITILMARFEQSQGHFKKARMILKKDLIRHPRDPGLILAMADNDRVMGRFDIAGKEVEQAMSLLRSPHPLAGTVPNTPLLLAQARTALDLIEKDKAEHTRGHLELMAGETAFTQYTQYYYAQIGDILPLTGLGSYSLENGDREAPILHLFLMGNAFTFEYHPSPSSTSFLSQTYEGLTPAVGIRFPTSFGYWEGDVGVAIAQHFQTLTTPGTVSGLFLQTDLLWNFLGGGLDLFANYTGYINYVYFQARYLKQTWESDSRRIHLEFGPEFITQGNSTYDAFQGGIAMRLWLAPLHSSLLFDGGILNSSAFPGVGGYEGVSWYFLY